MRAHSAHASVDELLQESVRRFAERPALVYEGSALRYRELDEAAAILAGRIETATRCSRESLRGRPIAVIAPTTPALVVALFALWRVGAVAVPLNARFREHELRQILVDAEPVAVVSVRSHLAYAFTELLPRVLVDVPGVRACLFVDDAGAVVGDLQPVAPSGTSEPLAADVGVLLYTSGTSGTPKGALVQHARELHGARTLAGVIRLVEEDTAVFVIPISHAFGLTCMLAGLARGAQAVLVDSTSSLRPLLDAVERHRATVLHGSPRLFATLLDAVPGGLSTIRSGFVAGSLSPPGLIERLDDAGMRILNVYGLTEAGAVSSCRPDDPADVRYATAGRSLPGYEVRVASESEASDTVGVLQVRGEGVTPGYHGRPDETAAAFDEGWFQTGDLAEVEGGVVRILGRSSDVVHVGGFNVFPAEVEAVLMSHPDVLVAAVVGVGDVASGESLRAFVVPRREGDLSKASLLAFARSQIAGYKVPYAIDVLPELPLLPSGKPDRVALSSRATAPPAVGAGV